MKTTVPKHVLVLRFSSFGDVAMTVPVIDSLARAYPKTRITVVSRARWALLFAYMPDNVRFVSVDLERAYRGVFGVFGLFTHLKEEHPDAVADLHDVMRTQYVRLCFRLSGVRVAYIRKGRAEKKRLTRRTHKVMQPLASSFERYLSVFRRLGFEFNLSFRSIYPPTEIPPLPLPALTEKSTDERWLGIAPFAKYPVKTYDPEGMRQVIAAFAGRSGVRVILFGGEGGEARTLAEWASDYPSVISVAGLLDMRQELALMSRLDVMLSMDSANMHLASLVGVPVVSVWGATHPYAGFLGWGQREEDVVQADLSCRPCSVFGNKPCYKGTCECMKMLSPDCVIRKIDRYVAG